MRDALRLKRFVLGHMCAAGLGLMTAALISACAVGPDSSQEEVGEEIKTSIGDAARKSSNALSYFLASPADGGRSSSAVSGTYQIPSGATIDVWREAEPARTVSFDEIRALRIREGRPSLLASAPRGYVVAEVEVDGSKTDSFLSLLEEQGDAYLWVAARDGEAIDFLPIVYAVRPSEEGSLDLVWISAGTFQNRQEAEAFFGDLGGIPRTFVALSDAERAGALATNTRLVDYAIWERVCDPAALAESGGNLSQFLPELPDYAERARGMDCRVRPQLGGASPPDDSPAGDGERD